MKNSGGRGEKRANVSKHPQRRVSAGRDVDRSTGPPLDVPTALLTVPEGQRGRADRKDPSALLNSEHGSALKKVVLLRASSRPQVGAVWSLPPSPLQHSRSHLHILGPVAAATQTTA